MQHGKVYMEHLDLLMLVLLDCLGVPVRLGRLHRDRVRIRILIRSKGMDIRIHT
jgi:hypothetical protein